MIEETSHPALIVITPVRNEVWVLDAFLTCASSWADHIIIADQHSTDGSREIAAKYEKVILVDNDAAEMNQAAARLLLFQEVDKIAGDKIVFALDADEFLSEGFEKTEGWQRIINSQPNELFCFKWLNLYGDYGHALPETGFMEWACHFEPSMSIAEEYERCERRAVHEMRVPCLPIERARYVDIDDIRFVHLANLNQIRQSNKFAFYQVHTVANLHERKSAVSLFRSYNQPQPVVHTLKKDVSLQKICSGSDVKNLVKTDDIGKYYIDEMISIFNREGLWKFLKLDIWDNPYLKAEGINPKLPLRIKVLHWYLRKTQKVSDKRIVKAMDKVFKLFC